MSRVSISRSGESVVGAGPEIFTGIRIETSEAEWADTGLVWTEDILKSAIARLESLTQPVRTVGA